MFYVLVVLDSANDPIDQVNVTILGNLDARNIPLIIIGNKTDLKKADVGRIRNAFPVYKTVGISAKTGYNVKDLYKMLFDELK